MRVLHLPTRVGGNAWELSRAERELGVKSDVLFAEPPSIFGNPSDLPSRALVEGGRAKRHWNCAKFYRWACERYDVFHFNWGSTLLSYPTSILPPVELPYLKRRGKIIAVTYQGSDARQEDFCAKEYVISHVFEYDERELEEKKKSCERKRVHIDWFDRYADCIYTTNPDLKNVLPERTVFRPYTKCRVDQIEKEGTKPLFGTLKLVHAPTNRTIKGTKYLIECVNQLRAEGFDLELTLVEGVPNSEAMTLYRQADVIVDQLLLGWYGGFAVECMALGKPVVSFIRREDLRHIPREMSEELPIINASPETLKGILLDILDRRIDLVVEAHRSRAFVEKWHNCTEIAKGIVADYAGAIRKNQMAQAGFSRDGV